MDNGLRQAAPENLHRGEFHGKATEYFGIWIVNILLTIVTLGIYSAWAKVRRNRYFYGNTVVDGHAFEYHARGKQIFIGRVIVLGVLLVANLSSMVVPFLGIVFPIVVLLLLPWLFKRAIRFSARVTSYRNVRFDFVGTTGGAFKAVLLSSIISVLSLGLAVPVASRWYYKWIFDNLRYGDRRFASQPPLKSLYIAWIFPLIIMLVGVAALAAVFVTLVMSGIGSLDDVSGTDMRVAIMAISQAAFWFVFLVFMVAYFFYKVAVRNIVMNATLLDGRHRLFSDLKRLGYLWVIVSNTIVSVLTLGLMRPWAAVREQRYSVTHTGILIDGDMGEIMNDIERTGPAASAEFLDLEGFDFGF